MFIILGWWGYETIFSSFTTSKFFNIITFILNILYVFIFDTCDDWAFLKYYFGLVSSKFQLLF